MDFFSIPRRTAIKVESIIRNSGAIPATIGIINGIIFIGLQSEQLEWMAKRGLLSCFFFVLFLVYLFKNPNYDHLSIDMCLKQNCVDV